MQKSDIDKILSLGLGADDYVTKPFSPGVLVARVRAQLRRCNQLSKVSAKEENSENLVFGNLMINIKAYSVILGEKEIELTAKEFEVLKFLALHPNQVLTREQIFDAVWGYDDFGDITTVTVHIRKIREKLEKDPASPELIKTIWGVGYKFEGKKS